MSSTENDTDRGVDAKVKAVALLLLKAGHITQAEAARYCFITHAAVRKWCIGAYIDAKAARLAYIAALFRKTIDKGSRIPSKREMQAKADNANGLWSMGREPDELAKRKIPKGKRTRQRPRKGTKRLAKPARPQDAG